MAGSTYTVVIDEAITGVATEFAFVINNWKKCATISTQSIERQEFDLDAPGTWIQLKVELRSKSGSAGYGDSPELEKLMVKSDVEWNI